MTVRVWARVLVPVAYLPGLFELLSGLQHAFTPNPYVLLTLSVGMSLILGAALGRWWALIGPSIVAILLFVGAFTVADRHIAVFPGSDTTQATQVFFLGLLALGTTACLALGLLIRRCSSWFAHRS